MDWSFTNLLIQIVAGVVGGHAAAIALKEHSFGALGHTVAGAIGGALSGFFLQRIVVTMVTGTGDLNQPTLIEQVMLQCLAGLAAGGIAMMIVGFAKHGIDQSKSMKG